MDNTQTRSTLGRTPADKGWASRRNFYMATKQHSQQADIHAPGGILTRNSSKRAAFFISEKYQRSEFPLTWPCFCLEWRQFCQCAG